MLKHTESQQSESSQSSQRAIRASGFKTVFSCSFEFLLHSGCRHANMIHRFILCWTPMKVVQARMRGRTFFPQAQVLGFLTEGSGRQDKLSASCSVTGKVRIHVIEVDLTKHKRCTENVSQQCIIIQCLRTVYFRSVLERFGNSWYKPS